MQRKGLGLLVSVCLGTLIAMPAFTAEILVETDFKENLVIEEHLVKVADNAVFVLDASGSMNDPFQDSGKSKWQAVTDEFKSRNAFMPELGHKFGLYAYTPWNEFYPVQTYGRAAFAAALDSLPAEGKGPTKLRPVLNQIEKVLKTLSGKTALYLFSDGTYTESRNTDITTPAPHEIVKRWVDKYNVCIYVISTAKEKQYAKMLENISKWNSCSRVIPLENFVNRPQFTTGALFKVKATAKIVTTTEQRLVGFVADNVTFEFDKEQVQQKGRTELDEVGSFLGSNPESYIVIDGYTDSRGSAEYNLALSQRRAESVAAYLTNRHSVGPERMVVQWYGAANPVASNDSEAGQASNRRVEMAVGM